MPEQRWNPRRYAETAGFVPALGLPVLELLDPQPGERVLDLGCGDGALSVRLLELGAEVVGVDSSPEMVEAARALGVDAHVADATALGFTAAFDAVFSNAVLHWVPQADAVVAGVRRALRPGGRFVGEFGGYGNVAAIGVATQAALRLHGFSPPGNPWYFPAPDEYAAVLTGAGFAVEACELIPRPTPLPEGLAGWLETFGEPLLAPAPAEQRAAVVADALALAAPWLRDAHGGWVADYVRLRFAARREA